MVHERRSELPQALALAIKALLLVFERFDLTAEARQTHNTTVFGNGSYFNRRRILIRRLQWFLEAFRDSDR